LLDDRAGIRHRALEGVQVFTNPLAASDLPHTRIDDLQVVCAGS
jgi:hypothetical protein